MAWAATMAIRVRASLRGFVWFRVVTRLTGACCADHDVALEEAFIKDVYDAVRGSPNWNDTLLLFTWDGAAAAL